MSSTERSLVENAGADAGQSCGVCGDTGLVDHDDGDAYGCTFCVVGQRKTAALHLKTGYVINDVTAAVRRPALRLGLPEYAKTPAGRRDPHLDRARRMVMDYRRAQKEKKPDDRPGTLELPSRTTRRDVPSQPGGGTDAERVLRDGQVAARRDAPVDTDGSAAARAGTGGAAAEGPLAGD